MKRTATVRLTEFLELAERYGVCIEALYGRAKRPSRSQKSPLMAIVRLRGRHIDSRALVRRNNKQKQYV